MAPCSSLIQAVAAVALAVFPFLAAAQPADAYPPQEFTEFVHAETQKWSGFVRENRIRLD